MKVRDKIAPQFESLNKLVAHCMEESGNDLAVASAMVNDLLTDDALWDSMGAEVLFRGCKELCRQHRFSIRMQLGHTGPAAADGADALSRRITASIEINLYLWPLSSAGYLGDASREDVQSEAASYRSRETQNAARARWFEAVADLMEASGSVREQIQEQKLRDLFDGNGVEH